MYQVPFHHVSRVADLGPNIAHMRDIQSRDIDAGDVDPPLDQAISDHGIYWGFRGSLSGLSPDLMNQIAANLYTYGRYRDFADGISKLNDQLNSEEKNDVMPVLSGLLGRAEDVGRLFPDEMSVNVVQAYGESITSIIFTLLAQKRGDELPSYLPLRGGGRVNIGRYSFEETVETMRTLDTVLAVITGANSDSNQVTRVNQTGAYGAYRLGSERNVLAVVRLTERFSYDPAIEYGNNRGAQASIGYSAEEDLRPISPYKKEQRSPFCIRIDNEGDAVALDIGSIFGPLGSLGKRVADIIALGDHFRSERIFKDPSLNHNSRSFAYAGFERPEEFARHAAEIAEKLETRCAAASATTLHQLALRQTVDA